ncbi:MAG: hypothetical protein COT85_03120 [Chlamydiae bacterium CG10_big_fil_rev_8_21_14_0_10_42_34]|nr:MAG: hypothetical protein COT85_03120 [Chlamydiae bacterium CG10_big_fil_rev_8_21_14_0_10_42_34]
MKKIILALVALGFAFAISSCCDQSYCPGNRKCQQGNCQQGNCRMPKDNRWSDEDQNDQQMEPGQQQERQHRRW